MERERKATQEKIKTAKRKQAEAQQLKVLESREKRAARDHAARKEAQAKKEQDIERARKLAKMKEHEEDGHLLFAVQFKKKNDGSLGLWFEPETYPPTLNPDIGMRHPNRLRAGDALVGINDDPLPKDGTLALALEALASAQWPKKLHFKRKDMAASAAEAKSSTETDLPAKSELMFEITDPPAMRTRVERLSQPSLGETLATFASPQKSSWRTRTTLPAVP